MPIACSLCVVADVKHSRTQICDVYTHTQHAPSETVFLQPQDKAGRASASSPTGSLTDDHLGKEAVEWEGELA